MNKEYPISIKSFAELEKALNDGFNVFKKNINISNENLFSLASLSKFSYSVEGDFNCYRNKLESLEGCPISVGGFFNCSMNKLTTLKGCPNIVNGGFYCSDNKLTTLEGCPETITENFTCYNNQLTSLKGCPKTKIIGSVSCQKNKFIPLEKKKGVIFKLGSDIYAGTPTNIDIDRLIKCNPSNDEESKDYYTAFNNFIKSTVKIDQNNITETDIIINGKKFKRKFLKF